MRSVCKDWLAASRSTWRRDLAVLTLAALAATVASCGGGTTSLAKCSSRCYAVTEFYHLGTDFASTPHGVLVTMDIVPLTCDNNCVNESGFIRNYVLLGDSHLTNWVQIGYSSLLDPFNAHTWDYYSEEAANNKVTTYFFTAGSTSDLSQAADFTIHHLVIGTKSSYLVQYTTGIDYQDYLWTPGAFTPGAVEAGEVLHGSQGEAAESATYNEFKYSATDLTAMPIFQEPISNFSLSLLGIGHIESDHPPSGVWVGFEGNPAVWFQTWCC